MKYRIVRYVVVSLVLVASLGFYVLGRRYELVSWDPKEVVVTEAKNEAIGVEVTRLVSADSWVDTTVFDGTLKSKRKSELGFERSGRLALLNVEIGDAVKAGQVVAKLDTEILRSQAQKLNADKLAAIALLKELEAGPRRESIEAAQATVQECEEELRLAKSNLERRKRLVNSEAISREDFEQAEGAVRKLEASRLVALKNLEELKLGTRAEKIRTQEATIQSIDAAIQAAQIDIEHCEMVCPFDGVVIERHFDEGAVVNPGSPVYTISEVRALQAHIGIPPEVVEGMKVGDALQLRIQGKEFDGKLKAIVPQVEADTLTSEVVITLLETGEAKLFPGDVVQLELEQSKKQEGYWLNAEMLVERSRGLWDCYVVELDATQTLGQIAKRPVEVLQSRGGRVLVRGAIHEGDLVVSSATHRLVAGQVVKPILTPSEQL